MLLTREELDETARIHPQVQEFFTKNPPAQLDYSDHVASRASMAAASKMMLQHLGPAPPGLTEFDHDIVMRDGFVSTAKIQKPTDGPPGPLIVLAFGGGFIAGDKDQLVGIGRILVKLFGATVLCIAYRLAPEYPFPYAQHDAWDSTAWAAAHATDAALLAADPSRGFILGGVSAGGAIAAALSRKFQQPEHRLPHPLTGQWLCIPSLMDAASCPPPYRDVYIAYEQNSDTPALNAASRDMMRRAAQWDVTSDLRYAALSSTPLAGQPRTYFQVDGMDPLRDDALIYDEMLRDAGVPTKLDLYPGCPHAHFFMMRGYEIGDRGMIDVAVGFGWLLEREVARTDVAKMLGIQAA